MKTYGLIWPNGEKELRSIVLDDEGNPRIDTLQPNPLPDDWQAPQIIPLVKLPQPDQGAWEPNVVWFDDRVERQWIAGTPAPAPTYTPEAWTAIHFSAMQVSALQRFEMALMQAGKPLGPLMTALKAWLEGMLVASVDPTPRTFDAPPCSYEQASAEAVQSLSPVS
jgi:hypothetical protein